MSKSERGAARRLQFLALADSTGTVWDEPNLGHFKFGPLNFYPSTSRYYFDGHESRRCSMETAIELARKIRSRYGRQHPPMEQTLDLELEVDPDPSPTLVQM